MLVERGSDYHKQIRMDEMDTGSLIGRVIDVGQHDDEQTAFRQCMARIRMKERRNVEHKEKNYGHKVPVALGDDPPFSKKKYVFPCETLFDL